MYKYVALLLSLLAIVAMTACGGSSSKTTKIPGVGEVSTSNKVPDAFPKDFPIYSGAKVTASSKVTAAGKDTLFVNWETGDAVDKVKQYFSDQFDKGPWKSTSNIDSNGSLLFGAENKDSKKSATLTVSRTGDKTTIGVFAGDNPSLDSNGSGGDNSAATSSSGNSNKTATSGSGSGSTPANSSGSSDLPPEAKLSKDFPSDRVPLPSGARVTSASSFGSGGSKTYSIEVYVKDTAEKVAAYFNTELPKHGWTSGFTSDSNGEFLSTFTKTDADPSSTEGVTLSVTNSDTKGYAQATILVTTGG